MTGLDPEAAALLDPRSPCYRRFAGELVAMLMPVGQRPDPRWVRVGSCWFRPAQVGLEARSCWGRYEYAYPVLNERDAVALAMGLVTFASCADDPGQRIIRLVWR